MTDTTAKIRAKGLDSTGVTEDLARRMYDNVGGHYVAIVDLKVKRHGEDDDGNRAVELVIDTIEPVVDGKLNGALVDHVREIQRALYRNRKLAEDGPQLPVDGESSEPTVEEVMSAREALIDHDDEGPKLWDGESMPEDQPADEEPAEDPTPDDPAYEPHQFMDEGDDGCGLCGQVKGSAIHQEATVPA